MVGFLCGQRLWHLVNLLLPAAELLLLWIAQQH